MKSYLISVLVSAVVLSLAELVIPSGRLKGTVKVIMSLTFMAVMIMPIVNFDLSDSFRPQPEYENAQETFNSYVDSEVSEYYENYYKQRLFDNDLVAEKIIVESRGMKITKVDVYLSNLVIVENDEHININVIKNYIAEKLSLDSGILSVYG